MLLRWSRAATRLSKLAASSGVGSRNDLFLVSRHGYAAVAPHPSAADSQQKDFPSKSPVNLDKLFWSKPCSLALPADSLHRVEEPKYEGIWHFILRLLLFYSKQSTAIRGANVIYKRIISQVDKPPIYEVFNLEKTFRMTFSLLVLHMWLCLRRLKAEGKEGVELGQYVYEIYNHDVELRVSKAGIENLLLQTSLAEEYKMFVNLLLLIKVNLLLTKWMKELERIFYGNIVAYDMALLPEAKPDEFQTVIWRNIFCDDGTSEPDDGAWKAVQAMTRYVRREVSSLSLTDKGAMLSGNFMFTSLENKPCDLKRR